MHSYKRGEMEGSPIDIVVFAPLAPILGVLLFWFIQLLFIQSEKYLLEIIRPKHGSLCRFTNFLGILFQSICHALGFTVTKSGVSEFYISVNYGKVAPKKEKKGIFEWIANVFLFVGPFFIPAFLLLVCLFFLMNNGFDVSIPEYLLDVKYTFAGQISILGASLYNFSQNFFGFLSSIDLFHPGHLGFLILLIFLGMGIRPSYIGEQKKEKIDIFYDLKNIWSLISIKPHYVIILFLFGYIIFYISVIFDQMWYVTIFSVFGWLSIISIASIFIADLILLEIKTTDEITGNWKFIPYITMPVSYILIRLVLLYFQTDYTLPISLLIMIFSTALITILLLKYKTNRFKTGTKMKSLRGKDDKEKKGKRRTSTERTD